MSFLCFSLLIWSLINTSFQKFRNPHYESYKRSQQNKSALAVPLLAFLFLFIFSLLLFIFSPLGARWGQLYSIGTDYTEVLSELRHRYVSFFKNHVKKWRQYCNDVMLLLKRWINKWRFWLCWYGFFKDSACHARIPTTDKQTKSATTNVSANHWFSTTEKNRWSLVKSRFHGFHCKYCE